MSCWYLTNDLMFSSRVTWVAERLAKQVEVLNSTAALEQRLASGEIPKLVLIDLSLPDLEIGPLVSRLKGLPAPPSIIAYGPHVHAEKLAAAQAAGCNAVLARGQFDKSMEAVLSQA